MAELPVPVSSRVVTAGYPYPAKFPTRYTPIFEKHVTVFYCRDLDLGPMTLKVDQNIDIIKLYLCTENEVAMSSRSKVIA